MCTKKYSVMIVDDEIEVREGIVEQLDWEALGFQVTAQSGNGQEALELATSQQIDLLMTDIKMPFMDGLTMLKEFRMLQPSAKVVIFSGFGDIQYAQQAIRLGVSEYLLKPISSAKLREVVIRIRNRLEQEQAEKRDIAMLRTQYENSLLERKTSFLGQLLWNDLTPTELESGLREYELGISQEMQKVIMVCDIALPSQSRQTIDQELLPIAIRQIIEEPLKNRCHYEIYTGFSQIVTILSWNDSEKDAVSQTVYIGKDVTTLCQRILDISVRCGISNIFTSLADAPAAYSEARSALACSKTDASAQSVYIGDVAWSLPSPTLLNDHIFDLLLSAFRFGTHHQVSTILKDIIHKADLSRANGWQRMAFCISLSDMFNRIVISNGLSSDEPLTNSLTFFSSTPATQDEIQNWALKTSQQICSRMIQERECAPQALVKKAQKYIQQHYSEPGLTSEVMCAYLHVSRSHFFSVFKRETGCSFVKYLTDIRMEKALAMLLSTDKKTLVIAQEVGYDEPNYFSYVFKQRYGMTPVQYRKMRGA